MTEFLIPISGILPANGSIADGRETMMDQAQANKICEDNELAFFRTDVCLGSPQSFTLKEKARICDDMEATNKAIEDAIRKCFEAMLPEFQVRLLDMLSSSGCMTPECWCKTLFGKMRDSPGGLITKFQASGNR